MACTWPGMSSSGEDAMRSTASLTTSMLLFQLAKEILGTDQMVVEDSPRCVQEFRNLWITYGVSDGHAFLATGDDVVDAQYGELLRHDRLLNAERALQLLDVLVAVHEELEDADAHRMRERLEERRLECLKWLRGNLWHKHDYITFFACAPAWRRCEHERR